MSDASEITRSAKSNLAFALRILPRERRDDAVVFYAFCRTLDDLAEMGMKTKAMVIVTPSAQMPTQTGLAAIFRY